MKATITRRCLFGKAQRAQDAGITLIEMLVVLAVIGVATGATMLGFSATDRDARASGEAARLAANLSLGVDEALVGGTPLALIWDADGYRFVVWSADTSRWEAARPQILAARHDLPRRLRMRIVGQDTPLPVIIDPSGIGPKILFLVAPKGEDVAQNWVVNFDGFSATALPEEVS